MSTRTITVKQAKPSARDFDALGEFLAEIQAIVEYGQTTKGDLLTTGQAELDAIRDAYRRLPPGGAFRVYHGGQMAVTAFCDPDADTVEVHPTIIRAVHYIGTLYEITAGIAERTSNLEIREALRLTAEALDFLETRRINHNR